MLKKKKLIIVLSIVTVVILVLGFTYALYTKTITGRNGQLIVGDIYMHYKNSNLITLSNLSPRGEMPDEYFEFTVDGKNTTTNKDINYSVVLEQGNAHATRQTRLDDKFLKFTLMEKKGNGDWVTVVESKSYPSLSGGINCWVDNIPSGTTDEVVHTYRLYVWIDGVLIGNVSEADYDNNTWNNDVYASVKVTVTGDFEEKEQYKTSSEKLVDFAKNKQSTTSCKTYVEEDGITYISGTKDCIDFNYVWWSGKMWRITAIYPDGAMKLVTDNMITSIAFNDTVTYYDKTTGAKSYMFQWLNEDFLDTLYNQGRDVIDTTKSWNATMPADTNITTKPSETDATMISTTTSPVGLLNSYEYYKSYQNTNSGSGYLNIGYFWWLLNPYSASNLWNVDIYGTGEYSTINKVSGVRPSIYLKYGISLSGSGTKESPYRLPYDYDKFNTNDEINTRHSGEYIKLSNNGTEQLFRIVSIENDKTKIVAMDYADNKATRKFATSTGSANTLWGSGTTTRKDTWYTYLNSTYYPGLVSTYGELFDSSLYYLGTSGDNYKLSVCANTTSGNTKVCDKTTQTGTFNIGLLRYGEMFATQQGTGTNNSVNIFMWLINRISSTYVWCLRSNNTGSGDNPTSTYGARPTVHLKSTVKILSGSGTELDPYVVGL